MRQSRTELGWERVQYRGGWELPRFPNASRVNRASHVDRYLPYLRKRWEEGCHNMTRLFQELVEQGYKGSYGSVRDNMMRLTPQGRKMPLASSLKTSALPPSREASF